MDTFLSTYIETALWSSTDNDGIPLDDSNYADTELAEETVKSMQADCDQFTKQAEELISVTSFQIGYAQLAHDFWLTRNGHGAGFWDGDYPEPLATQLTDLAHSFGESDLYVGDDGKFYIGG